MFGSAIYAPGRWLDLGLIHTIRKAHAFYRHQTRDTVRREMRAFRRFKRAEHLNEKGVIGESM
jgi:hypothetical protein